MDIIWNTQFNGNASKYQEKDGEWFEPDSSETEPGQAIDVKTVYENCTRAQVLPPLSSPESRYDIQDVGSVNVDEAFDTSDYTETNDFDMADVTLAQQILAEASRSKAEAERSSEQPINKASDERVLEADAAATTQQQEK